MKKLLVGLLLSISLCFSMTSCGLLDDEFWEEVEAELEEEEAQNVEAENSDSQNEESTNDSEELSNDGASAESDDASSEAEDEAEDENYPVGTGANISFDTVDINGNPVNNDMLKDARIVMLNLWEPWCGPCVGEMPDLNSLYENYKDQGLLIVGAYTTFDMDADAKSLVSEYGISYPIIKCNKSIGTLEQDYVPATFLLDRDGNLITTEPFAGSNSYSGWEEIIKQYL